MSPRKVAKALASIGIAALVSIFVIAVWVVRHHAPDEALRRAVRLAPGSLLHAQNFHWTQMKGAEKQWELRASEATYSDDKTSLRLIGTEFSMALEDGRIVRLVAPKAELKLAGNHINSAELSGGLELDYGTMVLKTDSAIYVPDQDQLNAPGPVQIRGDGVMVSGVGLTARPHAQLFELDHKVNTELTPRPLGEAAKSS